MTDTDFDALEREGEELDRQCDDLMAEGDAIQRELDNSVPAPDPSGGNAPCRTYTKEERAAAEEMAMKVGGTAVCVAGTAAALAVAGVVALVKKDSAPVGKTFDWCKKNLFKAIWS